MRFTLVIHAMTAGGAERAMSTLANSWAAAGVTVTLLTLDDGRTASFYALHPAVTHRPLALEAESAGPASALWNNFGRIRDLRAAIKASRPDLVVSLMTETNVLTLLAAKGLGIPVVVQEQVDPAEHSTGRVWRWLRRRTYPLASCVVVLTERSREYFAPAVRSKMRVIANPIVVEPAHEAPGAHKTERLVIGMGRLDRQKGFDLLIDAFGELVPRFPDWRLDIWGQGAARGELEALIGRKGLARSVRLRGLTARAHDELRRADLFVMSSRYEGFPLVLCEALGCGLPVVSFDCPTGPREIVRENVDGLLVPPGDVGALAAAMERLMADDSERRRLAARAPEVLERYGAPAVMRQWDELIVALLDGRAVRPAA